MSFAARAGTLLSFTAATFLLHCSSETTTAPVDVPAPKPVLTKEESEKPASCTDSWVSVAVGKVATDSGEAVEGALVGYCVKAERNVCLAPIKSEKGGWYTYRVEGDKRCVKEIVARAEAPEGSTGKYSVAYCPIPTTAQSGLLEVSTKLVLYSLDAPAAPATAARTPVKFPSGIELTFAPEDLLEKEMAGKIGAKMVDLASPPCFVKASDALSMLVVFGPDVNVKLFYDKPKIGFKVPNTAKLAEGSKVDLLILGGFQTFLTKESTEVVEEGSFAPYGTGTVKGGFVVPDPGSELPGLTALGIRPKK